jgi:hypothetical protein
MILENYTRMNHIFNHWRFAALARKTYAPAHNDKAPQDRASVVEISASNFKHYRS